MTDEVAKARAIVMAWSVFLMECKLDRDTVCNKTIALKGAGKYDSDYYSKLIVEENNKLFELIALEDECKTAKDYIKKNLEIAIKNDSNTTGMIFSDIITICDYSDHYHEKMDSLMDTVIYLTGGKDRNTHIQILKKYLNYLKSGNYDKDLFPPTTGTPSIGYLDFHEMRIEAIEKYLKTKSNGCYVATCVYGSYDCPEVWTLRRYRDYTLAKTWYGRSFIHTYYAVSPTLVKWFGQTKWFKKLWRGKLNRMVKNLQSKGIESTPYQDRIW